MSLSRLPKHILLGVTGGIACYKAIEITRLLKDSGYNIHVVMTHNATKFVTPLPFQTLSQNPVKLSLLEHEEEEKISHIELAEKTDLLLIAPATANFIGKLAGGLADDLLSTLALATKSPIFIAPAMNDNMWYHPAVQANIKILKQRGVQVIEPVEGFLACGKISIGRLAEPDLISKGVISFFGNSKKLTGIRVLITAGPTIEYIDPFRFISNLSSGKMGYALAEAYRNQGAEVTLISGKTYLSTIIGVKTIFAETAAEMAAAVFQFSANADIIIKSAAVGDFTTERQKNKIKKSDSLTLEFKSTIDILAEIGKKKKDHQILVGFAAETENLINYARLKLQKKNLDLIIGNFIGKKGSGFISNTNQVLIIDKNKVEKTPLLLKKEIAEIILARIENLRKKTKSIQEDEIKKTEV